MKAGDKSLRVAVVLHEFPGITQTFILNQLVSLLEHGCTLHIYATRNLIFPKTHADVARYGLKERTRYPLSIPRNYLLRVLKAIWHIIAKRAWLRPRVLISALDSRTHGEMARSLELLYLVIPIISDGDHDIVHCQFGDLADKTLKMRRTGALTGRLVVSFRGFDTSRYLAKNPNAYRELFERGDLFLPVSEYFEQRLINHGCPREKVHVLRSGIDLSKFPRCRSRRIGDPVELLTVGRLVEKKGVAYGMLAVAELVRLGYRVRYAIVGDGALRSELASLVTSQQLETVVEFLPWQEHGEVVRLMRCAHILLAPSVTAADGDQEGIPNVIKEALALGLPVATTRHSGIGELIEDGVSGLLAPERNPSALARNIRRLIDDPVIYHSISSNGRKRIEEDFDSRIVNESLYRLYLSQCRADRSPEDAVNHSHKTELLLGRTRSP